MQVKIIETESELLGMAAEWNELLESSESASPFLTHEWLSVWWKHMSGGRRLHLLAARENGILLGILPLAERRPQYQRMMPRVFEFLGSGVIGSDYLDVIAARGRERDVATTFAETLRERGLMIQLSQLRGGSCAALLAEELSRSRWSSEEARINICPYIDLRGLTWETYLAALGPNVRKNIKRRMTGLRSRFNVRVQFVCAPDEALSALDILVDLHRKRWTGRGRSEAFQSDDVIAFHRDFAPLAAGSGWLRLLVVYLDETPAAALYGLRYGPVFYFYQSGFDPAFSSHSVGLVTMGLAIQSAIEEQAIEYDMLHGNEEYKFHWAHEYRDLTRIEMHPPHAAARFFRRAIAWNRSARQMVRRMLLKPSSC